MGEITPAQAEARRRNGAKGMGPVTAEGKARSSGNATKHGLYATKAYFVADGSLREDPDDAKALYEAVVSSLEPGDDALLNHLAGQVATLLWRELRARRWEADALKITTGDTGYAVAIWASQAEALRAAAATVRITPDEDPSVDDTKDALSWLESIPEVRANHASAIPDDAPYEVFLKALFSVLEQCFDDDEDAAAQALELTGRHEGAGDRRALRRGSAGCCPRDARKRLLAQPRARAGAHLPRDRPRPEALPRGEGAGPRRRGGRDRAHDSAEDG